MGVCTAAFTFKIDPWPPYGLLSDLGTQISKSAAVVITVYCTHFGTAVQCHCVSGTAVQHRRRGVGARAQPCTAVRVHTSDYSTNTAPQHTVQVGTLKLGDDEQVLAVQVDFEHSE